MSAGRYTPGPHSVTRIKETEGRHFLVVAPNGCPLAKLEHCAEDEANANLFAAATDLVDALEHARAGLLWYQDRYPEATDSSDDEAMALIDAALAKATGSAP